MNKSFSVSKWIFLTLAVLTNSFVVAYSCLPASITNTWTSNIAVFFTKLINSITEKEVETVLLTNLDTFVSPKESYAYNEIPGYELNEIPLGSAKQVECSFLPNNATNTSVNYYTDREDLVVLNQTGNIVSVIGMGTGIARIYAQNQASGLTSSCVVNVVNTKAPQTYEISLSKNQIELGKQATLDFDIDGGVLGHDELINSRYYDIRKLIYTSSDQNVFTVDNYGVVHPISTGIGTICVENNVGFSKEIDVEIIGGDEPTQYTNLNIVGPNVCYGNDMLNDQNEPHNKHYQLSIFDGDEKLNVEDFIWKSSNELLINVDKHGVIRGFRKKVVEDESATITAISKLNGQQASFNVVVKEQLPSSMYYRVDIGKKTAWNPTTFTACVGDSVKITVGYDVNISNKNINATISDETLAFLTLQGTSFTIDVKQTGSCSVSFVSIANNELKGEIAFEFLKAGAIPTDEINDVGHSIRKTIGHAFMFVIAQVFLFIAIYMFLPSKELWKHGCLSLTIGLAVASVSEIIQCFVPSRQGNLLDVLINFAGVTIGALLVIATISITNIIRKNKKRNSDNVNNLQSSSLE